MINGKKVVQTTRAAKLLGCHPMTVRRWCISAIGGGRSKLYRSEVHRTVTGRYYVDRSAIDRVKDENSY